MKKNDTDDSSVQPHDDLYAHAIRYKRDRQNVTLSVLGAMSKPRKKVRAVWRKWRRRGRGR